MINLKNLALVPAVFLFISCGGGEEENNGTNLTPTEIILNQAQEDELDLIALLASTTEELGEWEEACEEYNAPSGTSSPMSFYNCPVSQAMEEDCSDLKLSAELTFTVNMETGAYEISGLVQISESNIFPIDIICELEVEILAEELTGSICGKALSMNTMDLISLMPESSICDVALP